MPLTTSAIIPYYGAIVHNLDLTADVPIDTITKIRCLVHQHKLLLIQKQGIIPEKRQEEITKWFGQPEIAGYEPHPKSTSDFVLRVSNEESEGLRHFGTSGFHIDCSFLRKPNSISIYHIVSVPHQGDTVFVPFDELIKALDVKKRLQWERLHMVKTYKYIKRCTDKPGYVIHPLIYDHPETQQKAMVIHQGHTSCFIWDRGTDSERKTSKSETAQILADINQEIHRHEQSLWYRHKWQAGDCLITDNLALAHWATDETQLPQHEVGLRVMHRTIVKGSHRPRKNISPDACS